MVRHERARGISQLDVCVVVVLCCDVRCRAWCVEHMSYHLAVYSANVCVVTCVCEPCRVPSPSLSRVSVCVSFVFALLGCVGLSGFMYACQT